MLTDCEHGMTVTRNQVVCGLVVALAALTGCAQDRGAGGAAPARDRSERPLRSPAPGMGRFARGGATSPPRRGRTGPAPGRTGIITGDDYPLAWKRQGKDAFATMFGGNRECVSFAAWKVYVDSGGRNVPTGRVLPPDWSVYGINVESGWGNAGNWGAYAASHGVRKDQHPTVGSIAHWNVNRAIGMTVGHVGVVKAVYGDGSIDVEQYNLRENGLYSVLHFPRNARGIDRSNGNRAWAVPWPDSFLHIHGR